MIDLTWSAPMDISGYGSAGRSYIKALMDRPDVDLKVRNTSVVQVPAGAIDEAEIVKIRRLLAKGFDPNKTIFVQQTIVEHFPYQRFHRAIGYTVFETETLHWRKAAICNTMDEIWVPSQFNYEGFINGGVTVPVKVIPHVVSPITDVKPLRPKGAKTFNFVYAAEMNWRKGWDLTVKAFCEAFKETDDVSLTLKVHFHQGDLQEKKIRAMIKEVKDQSTFNPTVLCITDKLSPSNFAALLSGADAFVMPSRGEAWGLTLSEAMSYGIPCIGTCWGGNREYMTAENSYLVDITGLHEITKPEVLRWDRGYIGQKFCEPSLECLRDIMRDIVDNQEEAKKKGIIAKKNMEKFSPSNIAQMIVTELT